ncbi:hypothetical protein D3228_07435 [Leucobacter luti]|nr:hypothetical protein [Leucobacter luti]
MQIAEPVDEETPVSVLEDFDFGNTDWIFVPHTETYPPVVVSLVDGTANVEGMQYTVVTDEILFSDADGDGDQDAIVPVEAYAGGNSVDRQWYIWAEHDGEAVQVEMPVARTIHCGTVTANVTAVDGGFEIHEFRHATGENNLACTDRGSDERVRTVGITDLGPNGALWPVQIAPFSAFGGICPASAEYDAYPLDRDVYAVPNGDAQPVMADGLHEWQLESWSIYSMTVPDWRLIGVRTGSGLGCAWANR